MFLVYNMSSTGTVSYTCMLHNNGGTAGDLTVANIEPGAGAPYAPKFEGKLIYNLYVRD